MMSGNEPFRELTADEFQKLTVEERQKYMKALLAKIEREKKADEQRALERGKDKL